MGQLIGVIPTPYYTNPSQDKKYVNGDHQYGGGGTGAVVSRRGIG